ncbi:IS200/IS605 family transposase [Staphylococcus cohnii]|uniref:IS200/IS605 family transposase n=2 Tax=Staphylococcus cohnii species complex TaxID=3239053 RepID=A0ABT6J3D9_9STAP|nr:MULTISPECIES: IS200/IS605 family transposase [Staphylococcus]MDH5141126.1 IS200/IS605 family transposase [Staphylococcus cohnii]MDH5159204.1 IS200/IS605 family transposase [Staphylococcus cohnii]MDK1673875.1 IS200/IS605 family transposase [Staphylococcus saprophyticus]MDW3805589.1 IS200/IS605 family transposase [Staphylococcus saprophyticus]MDW3831799.1 IS200/IS605 family transposase [Staphylococcus saprophyticus]
MYLGGIHMLVKTRTNVYDFNFHLVWVTKYRASIFDDESKRKVMKQILQSIAENHEIIINEIEVLPDHIHMMISFNPKHAPSSIVKTLKGRSARAWFKQYPETKEKLWQGHLWSPSFFMATLGNMSKDVVQTYIQNQLTKYNAGRPRQ